MTGKGLLSRVAVILTMMSLVLGETPSGRAEGSEGRRIWQTAHFYIVHPEAPWKWDQRAYRLGGTMMFLKQGKGSPGGPARPFLNFDVDSAAANLATREEFVEFLESRLRRFSLSGSRTQVESVAVMPETSQMYRFILAMTLQGKSVNQFAWLSSAALGSLTPQEYADRESRRDAPNIEFRPDTSAIEWSATYRMRASLNDPKSGKQVRVFVMHGYAARHPMQARHVAIKEMYWYLKPGEEARPLSEEDLATLSDGISIE